MNIKKHKIKAKLIMKNSRCILIGPTSCINHSKEMGFDNERFSLIEEELKNFGDFKIKGVFAIMVI